jgi:hypothetical protein
MNYLKLCAPGVFAEKVSMQFQSADFTDLRRCEITFQRKHLKKKVSALRSFQ